MKFAHSNSEEESGTDTFRNSEQKERRQTVEAQAITEVEIKEQQLVIAQWMQVPEEIIGILNQELPWRIREWIYLCALDQMPAEILEKMPTWELEKIQRERMEFLQKKFQDIDLLERAMKENQDRLEILAANSESADYSCTGRTGKGTPGSDQRERRTEAKVRTVVTGKTGVGISAAANEAAFNQRTGEPTECRGKCPDFKRKSRHLSQGTLTVSESRKKAGAKGNDSNRGTGKRVLEESQIPENGERTRGTAKKRDGDIYQRSHGQL